jgi:hypothetical protein
LVIKDPGDMTTPHRILPPNCWLPADAEATGAECSRFYYMVWWAEDCEDPEMPSQRCWHCRAV